jgi:hypothetical protein
MISIHIFFASSSLAIPVLDSTRKIFIHPKSETESHRTALLRATASMDSSHVVTPPSAELCIDVSSSQPALRKQALQVLTPHFSTSMGQVMRLPASQNITDDWEDYFMRSRSRTRRYQVIAHPVMEPMAMRLVDICPSRFLYHKSEWDKFAGQFIFVSLIADTKLYLRWHR